MIDTHSHIYDEAFDQDFRETLARAEEAGVRHLIFPGIDSSVHSRMLDRAAQAGGMASVATGLHPTSVGKNWKEELDFVAKRLSEGRWVALGEIGLDRHWTDEFFREQTEVFRQQMIWASQADLPVIIHVRDAHDTVFEILDSLAEAGIRMRGVFHAFSGSIETYRRIRSYGGFLVGIGGVITYRNAGIASAIQQIPLESILLETDSPWLAPVPYRGRRNEPAYLKIIAEKVASLLDVTAETVDRITTANAIKLFNLN